MAELKMFTKNNKSVKQSLNYRAHFIYQIKKHKYSSQIFRYGIISRVHGNTVQITQVTIKSYHTSD